jgi:hypothetical protein
MILLSSRRHMKSSVSISIGDSSPALGAGEPVWGATVFRLCQTVPDGFRALLQVGGSPFDSAGLRSPDGFRMACKRSGVRIPIAPLSDDFPGQSLRDDRSGLLAEPWASPGSR